jgi:hypothetical protein
VLQRPTKRRGSMPKFSEGTLALGGLAAAAIWLFAVLPFLYGPPPRFAETSSPPQANADQASQEPAAKPDGSVNAPFFIRIPKTAKEEAEEASDRREKSSTDRWLMIFTGAVALFTLLLVGATVMLYFAGEKQLRLASETSKRQSDEMQKSIGAANRSATVAENALIAADRAWISIKAEVTRPLTFKDDKIDLGVNFEIVNVGNSPATHVQMFTELCRDIFEAKQKGEAAANLVSSSILNLGIVLFPKETEVVGTRKLGISINHFREGMSALKEATAWPAVMACATYKLAGSPEFRHTVILFEVTHSDPAHLGWDGSEGDTAPFHLRLVQTYMSGQVT